MLEEIVGAPVQVIQGADGIVRRAFSAADVSRMIETSIMHEDEPFELVDGEFVFINPQGFAHDRIKMALGAKLIRTLPEEIFVGIEVSVQLVTSSIL